MKNLLLKYKEPILYIIFGVLTTLVNIVVYFCFNDILHVHYLVSNAIAWVLSVLFAFVTNKLFVFESKSLQCLQVMRELGGFVAARGATGVLDMVLMWLLVDVIVMDEMFAKILVNVLVIVLNYVASKLWIFRKKKS